MKLRIHEHECEWRERVAAVEGELERLQSLAAFEHPDSGLANYQLFYRDLVRWISCYRRLGVPCSVVLFDMDAANQPDHGLPPPVLLEVSRTLVEHARLEDTVCRLENGYFAVALGNATAAGAELYAERVRADLASRSWPAGAGNLYIQVNVGIAVWTEQVGTVEALLAAANASLQDYRRRLAGERARHAGRAG